MGKKEQKRQGAEAAPLGGPQEGAPKLEGLANQAAATATAPEPSAEMKAKLLEQVKDSQPAVLSRPILLPHFGQLLEEMYFG